jgi:signal transduction histidine kinase
MGAGGRGGQAVRMTTDALAQPLRRILTEPLHRRFWAELTWVALGVPLALGSLVAVLLGFLLGMATSFLFVGVLVITGTLLGARGLGGLHRSLAAGLLGIRVAKPVPRRMEPGLWNWIKARVGDAVAWRAIAYLVLRLGFALVSVSIVGQMLISSLALATYPVFWFPSGDTSPVFDIRTTHWLLTLPLAVAGAALFFAVPWVAQTLVSVDRLLVRGLLGPTTLSERVRDLEKSRATAVEDATVKLRGIERDLHDGAQAQLVALAMKLGIAKDEDDPEVVRALVASAHSNAKQSLVELRDLARGIHPAALDAGLDVALSTLVSSGGVPARLQVHLRRRPPPSIETIAYFSAAELLTNAAKHAQAPVNLAVTTPEDALRLTVTDNGPGGARLVPGGGLAGIAERLRTVDGSLEVDSPRGGPTVITVEIPLPG